MTVGGLHCSSFILFPRKPLHFLWTLCPHNSLDTIQGHHGNILDPAETLWD